MSYRYLFISFFFFANASVAPLVLDTSAFGQSGLLPPGGPRVDRSREVFEIYKLPVMKSYDRSIKRVCDPSKPTYDKDLCEKKIAAVSELEACMISAYDSVEREYGSQQQAPRDAVRFLHSECVERIVPSELERRGIR